LNGYNPVTITFVCSRAQEGPTHFRLTMHPNNEGYPSSMGYDERRFASP